MSDNILCLLNDITNSLQLAFLPLLRTLTYYRRHFLGSFPPCCATPIMQHMFSIVYILSIIQALKRWFNSSLLHFVGPSCTKIYSVSADHALHTSYHKSLPLRNLSSVHHATTATPFDHDLREKLMYISPLVRFFYPFHP